MTAEVPNEFPEHLLHDLVHSQVNKGEDAVFSHVINDVGAHDSHYRDEIGKADNGGASDEDPEDDFRDERIGDKIKKSYTSPHPLHLACSSCKPASLRNRRKRLLGFTDDPSDPDGLFSEEKPAKASLLKQRSPQ
ncbi:MAG: hypothetical protein AAGE61_20220 [Pseudomonadota bacterium]